MPRIFVSDRRSDAQMAAGRLREALSSRLGRAGILRDKDSIAGSADWNRAIDDGLKAQDVVALALIGPAETVGWAPTAPRARRPRRRNDGVELVRASRSTGAWPVPGRFLTQWRA